MPMNGLRGGPLMLRLCITKLRFCSLTGEKPVDEKKAEASVRKQDDLKAVEQLVKAKEILLKEIHRVIIGQDDVIEQIMTAMFCRGHCLVVGVPGLAKTLMVQTLAKLFKLEFNRVQFTPDLMPSDITGTEIIEEDLTTGRRHFRFVKGPIFANLLLADEINRTPPKTQSALLQAMQEYVVTSSGEDYPLDPPFFVLATQNPIEQEGTYPLPEAQLDRFMFMVNIGYPSLQEERDIIKATTKDTAKEPRPVLRGSDVLAIQSIVRRVPVSDHVVNYAIDLVRATRPDEPDAPDFIKDWLTWGAGPRAAQYLVLGAKARAIMNGRYNVSCKDVAAHAAPVLRHRIFTNFNADAEGITTDHVVEKLLEHIPEPSSVEYE
jgi:MoxR-like ATPase